MGAGQGGGFSEPSPRWGHVSAGVGEQLYLWGGRTKDFAKEKAVLLRRTHCWDPLLECWQHKECSGLLPPALYEGACASIAHHIYLYGGHDGSAWHGSLYQLDTKSLEWQQLSPEGPMKKAGCGMVAYGNKLVLFGGYGRPSGPTQPGAEFVKATRYTDGRGWTNELHSFDVVGGEGCDAARIAKVYVLTVFDSNYARVSK